MLGDYSRTAHVAASTKRMIESFIIKAPPGLSRGEIDKFFVGENGLDVFRTNSLLPLYFVDVIMHDILRVAVQDAQPALDSSDHYTMEFSRLFGSAIFT
uniref:hypothetical protein n=1 Tax=Marinobacterium profundum TaxID=1714300 RepID=UPI0013152203|nr:hypothetical protein [Marinobacterium profundum]